MAWLFLVKMKTLTFEITIFGYKGKQFELTLKILKISNFTKTFSSSLCIVS